MSTLSQFTGGGDIYRLKIKNGPYLDEVLPVNSGYHIRDFTAQNDNLMISMTRGDVYIGQRVNELLPCYTLGVNQITADNYDVHIGGDPYGTPLNRIRAGMARYGSNNLVQPMRGSYGQQPVVAFFDADPNITNTGNSTNSTSNNMVNCVNRFMYSGDDIFFINWSRSSDRLYINEWNEVGSSWTNPNWTYTGTSQSNLTSNSGSTFNGGAGMNQWGTMTWPELDPATGDIVMFGRHDNGSTYHKIVYDHSANQWNISDCVTGPTAMVSGEPSCLSIDGNNMMITTSITTATTYCWSSDGGANWSTVDVGAFGNWHFKQCGVANGRFYSINITDQNGSAQSGMLMSSTNPGSASSWDYVDTPMVQHFYLRNNGNGTACYASTGNTNSATRRNWHTHGILKFTG